MTPPSEHDIDSGDFDLAAGTYIQGLPSGTRKFLATTTFQKLMRVMRDPQLLQPTAKRTGADAQQLEEEASIHELIQRAMAGAKRSNVARYADYIEGVVLHAKVGVLPPMHLWSLEELKTVTQGSRQYLLIPDDVRLLAIDGETQLAAHFKLWAGLGPEERKQHGQHPLDAVVHHGISVDEARQYFHDLNVLGVRPSTSLGLAMDTTDPLMQVVAQLEGRIPFLRGRIDKQSRQLPKRSPKVITIHTLRQMVINVAKGIGGIQFGARPAPLEDVKLDDLTSVATDWLSTYFNTFPAEVVEREHSLAGTPAVLAAVGAMGHAIFTAEPHAREAVRDRQLQQLQTVNWRKGQHWSGIAGTVQALGNFKVGGTKEVAYAIFNVLTDSANPAYSHIRS